MGICPDTHRVPYHISFGVRSAGAGGRQRSVLAAGWGTPRAGETGGALSVGTGATLGPPVSHPALLLPGRSTSKGSPSSAADLQDFFTRMFQGTSGQVPGGFPPPPAPTAPQGATAGTTRAEGAVPKSDTKHKRRKKVRRPFQR